MNAEAIVLKVCNSSQPGRDVFSENSPGPAAQRAASLRTSARIRAGREKAFERHRNSVEDMYQLLLICAALRERRAHVGVTLR